MEIVVGDPYREAILNTSLYLKIVEERPAAPGVLCATCMARDGVTIYVCEVGFYPFEELLTPRCLKHRVKPIPSLVAEARIRWGEDPLVGPLFQDMVEEYWKAYTGQDLTVHE